MSGYAWMDRAACLGAEPGLWFPERQDAASAAAALAICGTCPVRGQCLEYALDEDIRHGVFGGQTPDTRRRLRRRQGRAAARRAGLLSPHGTPGAYRRHYRRGERPCDACARSEQLRHAPYNAARRAAGPAAAP